MTQIIYGAVGMLGVLILLALGAFIGWKGNDLYRAKMRQNVKKERTAEQERAALEEREAFTQLLNYNPDIAYGITTYEKEGV